MAKVRIGDLLIQVGLIDAMQLKSALGSQRQYGGRLGDLLVSLGFLDEMMLYRALAKQLGMKLVSIPELDVKQETIRLLPAALAMKHDVFPVHSKGRELFVATSDPNDIAAIDDLQSRLGTSVKTVLAPAREITWAIGHYYQGLRDECPPPQTKAQGPTTPTETSQPMTAATVPAQPPSTPPQAFPEAPPSNPAAFATPPAPAAPATLDAASLARLDATLRETQENLRFILDACIRRGVFTNEEFQRKMQS